MELDLASYLLLSTKIGASCDSNNANFCLCSEADSKKYARVQILARNKYLRAFRKCIIKTNNAIYRFPDKKNDKL